MQRLIVTTLLAGLAASPAVVQSDELAPYAGPYLGGGIGQVVVENNTLARLDALGVDIDDSATGYKLFAGYQFMPFVAMEASYLDFGDFRADGSAPRGSPLTTAALEVDAQGIGLALVGIAPLAYGVSLHAKLGMLAWKVEMAGTASIDGDTIAQDEDLGGGSDAFYGIGATYRVNRLMMRAEYEHYDISDSGEELETKLISASLGYHF